MRRLAIVQPYVPSYRVPFFDALVSVLKSAGIDCRVLAGHPTGSQRKRGDEASGQWMVPIPTRELGVGKRSVKLGGAARFWDSADGVVVGHVGSSLDVYRAILRRKRSGLRVGLWGHIKPYVNRPQPLDVALERWQLRNVDHVFAYTPGGAAYALENGVASGHVTTVMNTVDTGRLTRARLALTEPEIEAFRRSLELGTSVAFTYCGGLDESKRIDFLARALDDLWEEDPTIRILVAGRGAQGHLLDEAVERRQVIRLGYATPEILAKAAAVSHGFLNPGRIGLIAVDALVLGRPIVTTDWAFHAPEFEYLEEGASVITSQDSVSHYVAQVRSLAALDAVRQRNFCYPRLEHMVDAFATGVESLVAGQ